MKIYPSIDMSAGQCVRLTQGDFAKSAIYELSPPERALQFKQAGAAQLHMVDLDGAKNGRIVQMQIIAQTINAFAGEVQVGGGVRCAADMKTLLDLGATRVVVGTKAVSSPEQVVTWLRDYTPDCIVLALDFRMHANVPYLATCGWQQNTTCILWDCLDSMPQVKHILCTDISKDGMAQGPNFSFYEECVRRYPHLQIQASGGVSSKENITQLKTMGLSGCIIGKAIYENKLTLQEALAC